MAARAPHRPDADGLTVTLVAFDALAVAGADLRAAPRSERRARLEELLVGADGAVRLTQMLAASPALHAAWSPTAGRAASPTERPGATASGTAAPRG